MKNIFLMMLLMSIGLTYVACKKCEPVEMIPCEELIPNSENCGMTIATFYGREGIEPVGQIYDTRMNSAAPLGADWGPAINTIQPPNWNSGQIGQIFGIAIDHEENIYLASSDIYTYDGTITPTFLQGNIGRPVSSGQIFKCSPPAYNATPLIALTNLGSALNQPLNSLGNIAFDKWNQQLFVTNLEDGKIYRLATDGTILETYDPWAVDTGLPGIVSQEERVWGIGVNYEDGKVKIYFPRVSQAERSIYSLTLDGDAFPAQLNAEVLEILNVPGKQLIISDIAFSSNNTEMILSERGNPSESLVLSYNLNSSWILNQTYFIGQGFGRNAGGGVDFAYTEKDSFVSEECDQFFWASANDMFARNTAITPLYGLQGIAYSGNLDSSAPSPTANQDTDFFIDFDGFAGPTFYGRIGDVEVFDCTECMDPCTLNNFQN